MPSIADTAFETTSLDFSVSPRASRALSEASRARSAVSFTVAVISSKAADVSSSEAACVSVRCDSSLVALLISFELSLRLTDNVLICPMVSSSFAMEALKSLRSRSKSPSNGSLISIVKSPSAKLFKLPAKTLTTSLTFCASAALYSALRLASCSLNARFSMPSFSKRSFSTAASRNTDTALNIAPISSERSVPVSSSLVFPSINSFMSSTTAPIGFVMERENKKAAISEAANNTTAIIEMIMVSMLTPSSI